MNPLQLLEDPLRGLLDFLHDNAHLSYGWSIVVLTVIVRTALLPLVIKQYSSMRSMQMVAPQLKELQRKHKGNRQKLNEELMAFYKENEINPFASCLPLVAQIPIFIALYYVLKEFAKDATVSGGSVSFMWLIDDIRVDLQDIGWGAFVLVAIYGLSQLLSTELSATPNMPESQRRLMRILPVVVVIFVFQFPVPAGLVLYWMTTNLWTCGQQLVMRHRIGLHLADPEEVEKFTATEREEGLAHRPQGEAEAEADAVALTTRPPPRRPPPPRLAPLPRQEAGARRGDRGRGRRRAGGRGGPRAARGPRARARRGGRRGPRDRGRARGRAPAGAGRCGPAPRATARRATAGRAAAARVASRGRRAPPRARRPAQPSRSKKKKR